MYKQLFTSESTTEGHPDKLCDQISDAVLDAILEKDPNGRVACETTVTTGVVTLMGEISAACSIDFQRIARSVIAGAGYTSESCGMDANTCSVITHIDRQSSDIAVGVNQSKENKSGSDAIQDKNGAGDQGMMFGDACNETPELMPLPISLAHRLARKLDQVRKKGELPELRPDGKTQVTVEYINGVPNRVDTIVIAAQHSGEADIHRLRQDIIAKVILPVIPEHMVDLDTKIHINPTGRFVSGGPQADSGLTGRKIIVDTYGGYARHGGGAFSGKDPTKVDRSAAYAARYVAKNVVASGLASKCEIQIAYAIGVANPVSVMVDTFGTGRFSNADIAAAILTVFDLRPAAIIRYLDLQRPIYQKLAVYGHMGREDLNVLWEKADKAEELCRFFQVNTDR